MFDKIFGAISAIFISISSLVAGQPQELVSQQLPTPIMEVVASPSPEVLAVEIEVTPEPTIVPTARPTVKPTQSPIPSPTPNLPSCPNLQKKIDEEIEKDRAETKRRKELGLPLLPERDPRHQEEFKKIETARKNGECE